LISIAAGFYISSRPVPDLVGRNYLVTGANTGIGRVTALVLARRGAKVWLACRSLERAEPVAAEIEASGGQAVVVHLDLADLDSVRACAATFLEVGEPLDGLVNNAGIAWQPGGSTKQGFELMFGVNHLGHFLLTSLLLDALRAARDARIVNVSSSAHHNAPGIVWETLEQPTVHPFGRPEYCASKLSNVLHAKELARRLEGTRVRAYALHPGTVATDVWRNLPPTMREIIQLQFTGGNALLTPEEGAATTLHCATDPTAGQESGLYYDRSKPAPASAVAEDVDLARALWERSVAWTRG